MTQYTPAPGSSAAVAIEHLRTHGGQLTSAQIQLMTGLRRSNVAVNLRKAVDAKLLSAARRSDGGDRRAYVYTLGPKAVGAVTDEIDRFTEEQAGDPLQIVTYDDGDVVVSGYRECEGGGVIFSRAQMRQLVLRMTRPHIHTAPEA